MSSRLDEIDKRIIYRLSQNSRDTTASEISDEMNVSAGTVRNRIKQLEKRGIIRGYHANVDYERVENKLINLFECTSPIQNHGKLVRSVLKIPGVVNVRVIMAGMRNLHILAVGDDTEELTKIAKEISNLGIDIEDESLIQDEHFNPYQRFGPEKRNEQVFIGHRKISERAEAVDIAVTEDSLVAGKNLEEINEEGLMSDDSIIVAVERENETLTPRGKTVIEPGDIVTIFSSEGVSKEKISSFGA
ncbi:MAG: winged helix-turn-helix transcriptional regulator [Candidatus Hadarchaeia archaeon]